MEFKKELIYFCTWSVRRFSPWLEDTRKMWNIFYCSMVTRVCGEYEYDIKMVKREDTQLSYLSIIIVIEIRAPEVVFMNLDFHRKYRYDIDRGDYPSFYKRNSWDCHWNNGGRWYLLISQTIAIKIGVVEIAFLSPSRHWIWAWRILSLIFALKKIISLTPPPPPPPPKLEIRQRKYVFTSKIINIFPVNYCPGIM